MHIETDYLVVGAGASGLAFADSLLTEADVDVVLVDRRQHTGGHWRDAYPFVRLHSPSAYYGVNSMPLGQDQLIESGRNKGFYEQAGAAEICAYFDSVGERLASTGRAQFLAGHDHLGGDGSEHQVRDLRTGDVHTVRVRRRVVDATYLESSIPATHQPSFTVATKASFVPLNDLPEVVDSHRRFTVIGSGKTSADACLWLLDNDVSPDQIRWVRPRDAWFNDRAHLQPLDQVAGIMEGIALDAEAAAQATDVVDLFERLEASGRHVRLDPGVWPTMFRATMLSQRELSALQDIDDVVRFGRVRSIATDRIVLDDGEVPTGSDVLHVDCSAQGLRDMKPVPIFGTGQIVLQQVRHASPPFNAALLAFVEAHRESDEAKNRLCRPNPHPSRIENWGPMMHRTWTAELGWFKEPDVAAWIATSRLNLLRALPEHAQDPRTQEAVGRYLKYVGPAIERLSAGVTGHDTMAT
ncbi:MAG: NAD(P)-binding protein [Aeromicrobium sp.]